MNKLWHYNPQRFNSFFDKLVVGKDRVYYISTYLNKLVVVAFYVGGLYPALDHYGYTMMIKKMII